VFYPVKNLSLIIIIIIIKAIIEKRKVSIYVIEFLFYFVCNFIGNTASLLYQIRSVNIQSINASICLR